ncbi:hypothetical protein [Brevibacterium oceani]|uniref:hypothetical protein n=1 Tax=Brevibacterium oceani TaxID=358099 RepID=UPI0015E65626|nr:hypothetical protein [Brevibacterium oceani]
MFRTARSIVGLSLLGAAGIGVVVGWLTGFFERLVSTVVAFWESFTAWLSQPFDFSHLAAGGGVIIGAVVLLAVLFALTDR